MTGNPYSNTMTWVEWFCTKCPAGAYFVQIEQTFIRDNFNFFGLRQYVNNYRFAIEMIRGNYFPENRRPKEWPQDIEKSAIRLYGLLHARYLLTNNALKEMAKKYRSKVFEPCPRVCCHGVRCIPYGLYDEPDKSALRLYCPCCHEVYKAEDERCNIIDGAFFGHSYLLLLIQQYPDIGNKQKVPTSLRLFGFRIEPEDDDLIETESET